MKEHGEAAYLAVVRQVAGEELKQYRAETIEQLTRDLRGGASEAEALLAAVRLSTFLYSQWAVRCAAGGDRSTSEAGRVLNSMFLSSQLVLHDRLQFEHGFQQMDALDYAQIGTYFFLVATQRTSEAACVRRHLMKLWAECPLDAIRHDQNDFAEFLRVFMEADEADSWPANLDAQSLGAFSLFFRAFDETTEQERANSAGEFLDFRLARSLGYPSHTASRRNPEPYLDYWIEGASALVPMELFAGLALFQRTHGIDRSLQIEHPLLKPDLVKALPRDIQLEMDERGSQLMKLGQSMFGRNWIPLRLIDVP